MLAQIGSQDTLVGSAFERKINDVDVPKERVETSERLDLLRAQMAKDNLDYYIIPSEDAHGSEYVADWDKRREWISGFTGTAGQAIVSREEAFLITDSRYWLQADNELDMNWKLVKIPQPGSSGGPGTWQQWLVPRVQENMRIGMDARMISYAKAAQLTKDLQARSAKLVFPPQNYVDLIWKTKPARSKEPIFIQRTSFAGQSASSKLAALREWIAEQPPSKPSYSKGPPTDAQKHVAALVTSLPNIAWILNLRGRDIPYNPVFQAYLLVNVNEGEAGGGAILFTDMGKVGDDVGSYLEKLGVEVREYNDVWNVLRRPPWGPGKVLISEETSYAISLILTHFRYTVAPSYIDSLKAVKNNVETEGLRAAHLRDGLAYTRWLAWLEDKLARGYEITEYEAAMRLTEFRRGGEYFEGLAYENISASGPNAALPHYSPTRGSAKFISRETPYLNDSGGQYLDGTIDTTRTMHFGRPTQEQCEAYTRVLQGHIAIDSCFFPQGTTGKQLDVLARKALWKEGLNYLHGTGHGFGSFLNVHEGPHGFSSDVELVPGHVITNEPGFYNEGKWGMRIESALLVRQVRTKHEFNGPIWLGFERLTVVPIQTKMVKESLLSREEIAWIKEHNRKCRERLEPLMRDVDDKRALKWLRRESERGIGVVGPGPGNISIDWD
ncbi:Creatinase/aminopeptidase [Rickenella mellea]|uniref:Creatinase/aminopeptidase n=1 Tax=Rickenella mellea TaxID=50990 RepID=A0A4Y7Q2Q6_9AGAM|nr:Creatinase/aminopeptidase [Rickenella mellea]